MHARTEISWKWLTNEQAIATHTETDTTTTHMISVQTQSSVTRSHPRALRAQSDTRNARHRPLVATLRQTDQHTSRRTVTCIHSHNKRTNERKQRRRNPERREAQTRRCDVSTSAVFGGLASSPGAPMSDVAFTLVRALYTLLCGCARGPGPPCLPPVPGGFVHSGGLNACVSAGPPHSVGACSRFVHMAM